MREAPPVPLSLKERRSVIRELAPKYKAAKKVTRGKLISQLQELTGYSRAYAARVLHSGARAGRAGGRRPGSGRRPVYGKDVKAALKRIWVILDAPAGKRLAPFLPDILTRLEQCGEIHLTPDTRAKLLRISAATIDRLLKSEHRQLNSLLRGRSHTKPGAMLKGAIPVKTFAQWDDAKPGFLQLDLVAHDGGNPSGEFAQTLDMVDVATGWTVTSAVKNKAERWVFEALQAGLPLFPFRIQGIDSDNGGEFINHPLKRYCEAHGITFTRSRPYHKNDNCHVEQKNWTVVRKTAGYARYDTPLQLAALNRMYQVLRLYTNFFQPMLKLRRKERHGARVTKTYDPAQTPYQQVLASPEIDAATKDSLTQLYETLNPAKIHQNLLKLQEELLALVAKDSPRPTASLKEVLL